jgi:cellulose synthase/poly-beta-1,6-N-acetylglucosamine synthase-like glycosyltransferase
LAVWGDALAHAADGWFGGFVLLYGLLLVGHYLGLHLLALADAVREIRSQHLADRMSLFEGDLAPPISILVPAYNEGPTIVENVRSLMQLQYPSTEIIVVNDGSKDDTLEQLRVAFHLVPSARTLRARIPRERVRGLYSSPEFPFLVVLDVVNGGKARALNLALAFARHPLFCAIDADSVLERDTLLRLALPFYQDSRVIVTGGVIRPCNGSVVSGGRVVSTGFPRSHLARFQVVEYLRGMLAGRMGWNRMDSLFIVSGALGLFSREAVMAAGGYRTDTLGEDMELVMRLQRWARRKGRHRAVRFVSSAVAWTEVPETLRTLARQRMRWHQGLAESLWLNRGLLGRESFSGAQAVAFASQVLFELLGPVIELLGLALFIALLVAGRVDGPFTLLYGSLWVFGGAISSFLGLVLEVLVCPRYQRGQDLFRLLVYALAESLGYRQLTAWWRARGLWGALTRQRRWGEMSRKGHQQGAVEDVPATRAAA